jgi:GDP-L-fucose synthase
VIIDAAAKVGGILANNDFHTSLLWKTCKSKIIDTALQSGVEKFIFFGSSCIYPKLAPQPLRRVFIDGYLEPTNEWYAIAK